LGKERNKRAWQVIRKLKALRDEQAGKIDILCKDVIGAHGDFSRQLSNLSFAVRFYESLLTQNGTGAVLTAAAESIRSGVAGCNVAVFLADSNGFELHVADEDSPIDIDAAGLESYFTSEVVDSICRSNRVCSLDDMFEMGLIGNLGQLSRICTAAVPLGYSGRVVGFILLYRSCENVFTRDELARVVAITPGLCRVIGACQNSSVPQAGQMGTVSEI
jgi:hypothetical protein